MTDRTRHERAGLRILRFLARGDARPLPAAAAGQVLLDGGERGVVGVDGGLLAGLAARSLIAEAGGVLRLSPQGRAAIEPAPAAAGPLDARPRHVGRAVMDTPDGRAAVTVNHAESPLSLLRRRKGKDGRPFLDARESAAGERLRSDYGRGQIVPRLGVDWDAAGAAARGRGHAGGIGGMTDAALAARRRVEAAIEAVGPELSGVLIDVCCFLKGLEQVEMERGWPARPAILHWGAQGYRPTIGGR